MRTADEMATQRAVKLERMQALLAALGHPEQAFDSLLVAGTKGKGSTVAMLSACLRAAGLRTGQYTSPHLVNWRERTSIDGQPISTEAVVRVAKDIRPAVEALDPRTGAPTTFEVGTALSFVYFAEQHLDAAVIEVGTGGRFDATNLLQPLVSVITPISYDHTPTLGDTLQSIAWHKAGIVRAGRTCILAPQAEQARLVVEDEARAVGAPIEEVGREWTWSKSTRRRLHIRIDSTHPDFRPLETQIGLLGDHQRDNATTAVATLHALAAVDSRFQVPRRAIRSGLATVDWPGRLQILSRRPLLAIDGAHNAASAEVLRAAINTYLPFERLLLVLGLTAGKDARGVLGALAGRASAVYLTRSRHEHSAEPAEIEPLVRAAAPGATVVIEPDLPAAVEAALAAAKTDDLVLVTGSLFLVGETLVWWRRSPR